MNYLNLKIIGKLEKSNYIIHNKNYSFQSISQYLLFNKTEHITNIKSSSNKEINSFFESFFSLN